MAKFWSLTYKTIPREDVKDTYLLKIMLERLKAKGMEYEFACCKEEGEWPETPEGFIEFLNRQFPDSPVQHVLVDKREITEEEYLTQYRDKERRAMENAELIRGMELGKGI